MNKMDGAEKTPAELARLAVDLHEIQNVMSMHSWYHAHLLNDIELEKAWVQTKELQDTAVWAQNKDYWMGMHNIKGYYGIKVDQKSMPGGFMFHTLTTPIVVVAEDRRTAKGVWYTPGMVGSYKDASWLWERYGVDFANENGHWKIWHLHVYTDFGLSVFRGDQQKGEHFGIEFAPDAFPPPQVKASYQSKIGYRELGPESYPVLVPRLPEAYRTFDETFSYADPNEYADALAAIGAE